jgi:hypothetical protein
MAHLARLHVIFTMDCQPAASRGAPEGPKSWEQSARAIDGFCRLVHDAGYPVTLFLTPKSAEMHTPLIDELASIDMEMGLYVQPQSLAGGRYKHYLGQYDTATQREIVSLAAQQFRDAVGMRPQSIRSAMFSASDETFGMLYSLGFRQGSLSSPGRRVSKHSAVWVGAARDPHYVRRDSKLEQGDVPFLEVPVTTDADQERGGLAPDLMVEHGTFESWQRPLIEGQVRRLETTDVPFKSLCIVTRNCFAYHNRRDKARLTLDALLDYLETLEEAREGHAAYELAPTTLANAHRLYRAALLTEAAP